MPIYVTTQIETKGKEEKYLEWMDGNDHITER